VDPGEVIIVAGVAQALGLIAQTLSQEGFPAIAVEDPGSLGARQHLRSWNLETPPIPVDVDGISVDNLRESGAPAVLLTPAHQFPTGVRCPLITTKRYADLGNAVLPQLVLAQLMESGEMQRQLRFLRGRHRRRRDAMVQAIGTHLPGAVVHDAAAGLHLMVTFDADFADTELAAGSLARGVKVQPLSWHHQRPSGPGLVLGYAASASTAIEDGIATLGDVLRGLVG
jgi:GntR family transcriptional regulator/MocR family aminotransferase